MKLSEHFELAEFLASQTATRKGFTEQFHPPAQVIENLRALCVNVLQPLRESLNVPIRVASGYRCPRLNRAIGGARNSQHMKGEAADIIAIGVSNLELLDRIIALGLPFDQLINEFPDPSGNPSWVHVSFSGRNRGQVLVTKSRFGRVIYATT